MQTTIPNEADEKRAKAGAGSRAIKAALEAHPEWPLEQIGTAFGVSRTYVHVVRSQLRDGT